MVFQPLLHLQQRSITFPGDIAIALPGSNLGMLSDDPGQKIAVIGIIGSIRMGKMIHRKISSDTN
jgi:hypothetical protein